MPLVSKVSVLGRGKFYVTLIDDTKYFCHFLSAGCVLLSSSIAKNVLSIFWCFTEHFLQDINARDSPPKDNKPLRIFSIVGSVLSMVGLFFSIITLLCFK